MTSKSLFYNRGHEGEYVSIPSSRLPLPINSVSESVSNSRSSTPARISSPNLTVAELCREESKVNLLTRPCSPEQVPTLVHKWSHTHSILCLIPAPSKKLIFCGTQDSKILVFDLNTYHLKYEIASGHKDHTASILCLALSGNENYLFSAGSDSLVKVWDLSKIDDSENGMIHCTHIIYSLVDIGDVFSISWSESLSAIFIGAQNASILWCPLSLDSLDSSNSHLAIDRLPHFRYDKFFDSKGPGGSINTLQSKQQLLKNSSKDSKVEGPKLVEVRNDDLIRFAHNGYVYCMEIFDCKNSANDFVSNYSESFGNILVSCGGDGIVSIWGINQSDNGVSMFKLKSLENEESVLSMSIQDSYLYVGLSDSSIKVWDLMTFQLVRLFDFSRDFNKDNNISASSFSYDEVLSLGIYNDCIFKASNLGGLIKFTLKSYPPTTFTIDDERYNNSHPEQDKCSNFMMSAEDETYNHLFNQSHHAENGAVLAVKIFTTESDTTYLLSGGYKALCLWDITNVGSGRKVQSNEGTIDKNKLASTSVAFSTNNVGNEDLLKSLKKYISFKTISKFPTLYLEDSRHCAQFLTRLLISLGASQTKLLPVPNGNPVVYSRFTKNSKSKPNDKTIRVLWYAHYDVVDATNEVDTWATDPFVLTARDGNLYARGVSDNKGPSLAAVYAVSELFQNQELSCDVVFIIEGEEECGSIGFQNVINKNKDLIGDIDWIMLSNSYWLDDETPCLNYGLRGVINASITVQSDKPDRHSGVDGGVSKEPTMDLIQILGKLMDPVTNEIKLKEFYDDVLPLTDKEIEIYQKIEKAAIHKNIINQDMQSLMAKWRNPSLTVHKVEVSGPNNNTVIPQVAKASISIRIVPSQDLAKIKKSLIELLEECFNDLQTKNHLTVDIFHESEPWLGDPSNLVYQILYDKIRSNWGSNVPEPLFIREGGSIPSIRFLEKCFNAPAAQIPCGQASDNAHLKDEKLRIINLYKLRAILTDTLKELGTKQ